MKAQEILVARPSNRGESKTLKTLLKALKIKFEVTKESSNKSQAIRKQQDVKSKGRIVKLTLEEKNAIDRGLLSIKENRVKSHEAVVTLTRKKFPALFK